MRSGSFALMVSLLLAATACGQPIGETAHSDSSRQVADINALPPAVPASAIFDMASPLYRTVELPEGMTVSFPAHWTVLTHEATLNIRAAADATVGPGDPGKATVLALNSTPAPHGAQFRISITRPSPYAAGDFLTLSSSDLAAFSESLLAQYRAAEASGGPHIVNMSTATVEQMSGHAVLHISYSRSGLNGDSEWQVDQYKVPMGEYLVECTSSYRTSERALWHPILAATLGSLRLGS